MASRLARARLLALLTPAAALLGAYGFQYIGGLTPCEMCWWQRYAHFAALAIAILALLSAPRPGLSRAVTLLAGVAILVAGLIGGFHAGVEYHWWRGPERCTSSGFTSIADLMKAPVVLCDVPQWTLWHVSMAGWNFLFSTGAGLIVLALAARRTAR